MKIGILTFHLAHNYGAVLQCYALQEVLRGMGHEALVVDYQQPFMVKYFKPQLNMGFRSFLHALAHGETKEYLYRGFLPYVKCFNFKIFRNKFLRVTDKCFGTNDIPTMDLYIIGSDQPWNPDLTGGTDLVYWGQFHLPASSRLITYGMSGSEKAIGKVGWGNIKDYCQKFNVLSFREKKNAELFSKLTGKVCPTVLDPTLIADTTLWQPLLNKKWEKRRYILLYHVGGPNDVIETMTIKARQLAYQERCELIDASRYLYSPSDFVSLVCYAYCVVTASFHALAFSIVFKRPFIAIRTGQASDIRFESLLATVGLQSYLVSVDKIAIPAAIDYDKVHRMLLPYQEHSINYLQSQLRCPTKKDN